VRTLAAVVVDVMLIVRPATSSKRRRNHWLASSHMKTLLTA